MDQAHPVWRAPALTAVPSGHGAGYAVAISDRSGAPLATWDAAGTLRDSAGAVALLAPVYPPGRNEQPTAAAISVGDTAGRPLGYGRVVRYGIGPRARKATVAVLDPNGGELARLEPIDHRGDQLALQADGAALASVAVEHVKSGFLRRSRVYAVELADALPDALRPLAFAVTTRYDALLDAVVWAAGRHDRAGRRH